MNVNKDISIFNLHFYSNMNQRILLLGETYEDLKKRIVYRLLNLHSLCFLLFSLLFN